MLSVVIPCVNGLVPISACLSSLARQRRRDELEIIVVEGSRDGAAEQIACRFPWARLLTCPEPLTIPELRSRGILEAAGEIVAISKDHCVFDDDWCERIIEAHRTYPDAAIGGSIGYRSPERPLNWAFYACEYGPFMPPMEGGPARNLPGPNVSYKRLKLVEHCAETVRGSAWENALHDRLTAAGESLRLEPTIVAYHAGSFGLAEVLAQRFYFGRSYAAARVAGAPALRRMIYAFVAPFLPPLFMVRYARELLLKRRLALRFACCLPYFLAFAVAWSMGEVLGYGAGDGGASLQVR